METETNEEHVSFESGPSKPQLHVQRRREELWFGIATSSIIGMIGRGHSSHARGAHASSPILHRADCTLSQNKLAFLEQRFAKHDMEMPRMAIAPRLESGIL